MRLFQFVNVDYSGVLSLVRMVGAVVDVHVLDEAASEAVFGEHTFHNLDEEGVHTGLDVLVERFFHEHFGGCLTLSAGISCVVEIDAVGHLFAGEDNLVGVDDDYVVAALNVGRVGGFVFSAEKFCDFCAEATKNLVGCIDNNPIVLNLLGVGEFGAVANGIHF